MDTHFEQNLSRPISRPGLSLPGEDAPPVTPSDLHATSADRIGGTGTTGSKPTAAEPALAEGAPNVSEAASAAPARPGRSRRSGLMTGAAIFVVALAAAGVFLISPYNTVYPVKLDALLALYFGQPGAEQHIDIPAPVTPASNLARAKAPEPAPPHPAVVLAPPGLLGAPAAAKQRAAEMNEVMELRTKGTRDERDAPDAREADQSASTSLPAAAPLPPAPAIAQMPPLAVPTAVILPVPPAAAASTSPPAPLADMPTIATRPARDPVVSAAGLQAAPMSSAQEIQVLNLVTELGVLLRNQRTENAQLRTDVAQMRDRLDGQLGDYDRRLSLAEARGAINAAMGAGTSSSPTLAALPLVSPLPTLVVTSAVRPAKTTPGAPGSNLPDPARRYRVQAASPGLAMLAEIDRTGDVGNLLQVSIGDDVPGFGKVKTISQQGAAWVLTAERGTIR